MRGRRVQVERHIERLRPLEDRPEPLVVEEDPVGQAVYHRPLEAELAHRPFELVCRRLGVGGGQCGKGGEPLGMGTHCLIEPIVDAARQRNGGFRIEILEPRHRMRQHLQVDAGFVHFLQAQFADIVEALHGRWRRDRVQAAGVLLHFGIVVMLLLRNDIRFSGHRFLHGRHHWGIRSTGLTVEPLTASIAAGLIAAKS